MELNDDLSDLPLIDETDEFRSIDFRGIRAATYKKYGVLFKYQSGAETPISVGFPYTKDLTKVRLLAEKRFYFIGDAKNKPALFGHGVFPQGGQAILLTEGEFDAMSAYQMLGIPCLSVRSAGQAFADCKENYEYLNSFQKIYLCFDNDEAGTKALTRVAPMFDFNKVFHVKLKPLLGKDANEYLDKGLDGEFKNAFRSSSKIVPEGVLSSYTEVEEILSQPPRQMVCSLPFHQLNEMLQGVAFGESILFSGLEGIGKTEILRSIEHHVLKNTDFNIGIVHLEEASKATVNRLLNYEMEIPLHLSTTEVPTEAKVQAYKALTGRDNRVVYYSHYGEHSPDTILEIIRFLVAVCECKFVFFDHLNIVVSSMEANVDERRALDYMCTKIESLVENLNFNFMAICHTNDNGLTRGSRNISQTSHVHVRLTREIGSDDEVTRRRTVLNVIKNRPTGFSGPAGYVYYDSDAGVLRDPIKCPDLDFLVELKE